jgi:hypothetical protein
MKPPPITTARVFGRCVLEAGVLVHARQELGSALDPLADRPRVGHRAHLEDAGQVDAGQWRADRRRAGRQHQLVVGLGAQFAGGDVAQLHGLLGRRDGHGFAAGACVDGEQAAKRLNICDQKAGLFLDHAANVVRQSAIRVRHIRAALDQYDLGLFVEPAQACRARCSTSDATDDDHFHGVSFY